MGIPIYPCFCKDFSLFSRGDDGPRRFNPIGEDDGLK